MQHRITQQVEICPLDSLLNVREHNGPDTPHINWKYIIQIKVQPKILVQYHIILVNIHMTLEHLLM